MSNSKASLSEITTVQQARQDLEMLYRDELAIKLQLNEYEADGDPARREQLDREALIAEYTRLRQAEYEMTCLNEAEKMYALALDGEKWNKKTETFSNMKGKKCTTTRGHSNYQLPRGYKEYAASSPERKQQVEDSAARFGREFGWNATYYTCALASSCMVAQIGDKMNEGVPEGMSDKDKRNLMIKGKNDNPNGTMASYNVSSIPEDCKIGDRSKLKNKTVNELIADGSIGAGDQVIVSSNNGSSGRHALTVAAVERDASGKVVGYTLQGNNKSRLVSGTLKYDKNGKPYGGDSIYGGRKVQGAILTHKWMDKKISVEEAHLQTLSIEELQAQVEATRTRVVGTYNTETQQLEGGLMADLAATERSNANKGYQSNTGDLYAYEGSFLATNINAVSAQYAHTEFRLNNAEIQTAARNNGVADMMGRRSSQEILDESLQATQQILQRDMEDAGKKKGKNIFQKTGDWFKGAYATLTGKGGKKEKEVSSPVAPEKPQEEFSAEALEYLLGSRSEKTVNEKSNTSEERATDLAATRQNARTISAEELYSQGLPEMGIKPSATRESEQVSLQTPAKMEVHDFLGLTSDFFGMDTKGSMSNGADMMSGILFSGILGEYTSEGSVKDAMSGDYQVFLEMLGFAGENEGSSWADVVAEMAGKETPVNTASQSDTRASFKASPALTSIMRNGGWGRA